MKQLWKAAPAGFVDVGLASAATFAAGLYAVSGQLTPETLGGYSLFFSAFVMTSSVPTQFYFIPAQVQGLDLEQGTRISVVLDTFGRGFLLSAAAAPIVLLAVPFLGPNLASSAVAALAVTSLALTMVSPLQDHVRRTFHLDRRSWAASIMSLVQFVVVLMSIWLMHSAGVEAPWIPLGSLVIANIASISAGLTMSWRLEAARSNRQRGRTIRSFAQRGKWLFATGTVRNTAGFVTSAIVAALAGSAALGYAEAARQIAQPIVVAGLGLSAVLGPQSMEAARDHDRMAARRLARWFDVLIIGGGVLYLGLFGWNWAGNPFVNLFEPAYAVPWLLATKVAANLISVASSPLRSEMIGGRLEPKMTVVETVGNAAQIGVATTAGITQAFARPLAAMALSIVQVIGYSKVLARFYQNSGSHAK